MCCVFECHLVTCMEGVGYKGSLKKEEHMKSPCTGPGTERMEQKPNSFTVPTYKLLRAKMHLEAFF